jgi:hypothetical protein
MRYACTSWKAALELTEMRSAYKMLDGKPEGARPLGRPRRSWEDNIRMDLREEGWEILDWVHLT